MEECTYMYWSTEVLEYSEYYTTVVSTTVVKLPVGQMSDNEY